MDDLKNILEALIFISVEPLTMDKIKEVLDGTPEEEILQALLRLGTEMEDAPRPIRLVQTGGGWVFMTKPAYDLHVRKLLQIERRSGCRRPPWKPSRPSLIIARDPDRHHEHPRRRLKPMPFTPCSRTSSSRSPAARTRRAGRCSTGRRRNS